MPVRHLAAPLWRWRCLASVPLLTVEAPELSSCWRLSFVHVQNAGQRVPRVLPAAKAKRFSWNLRSPSPRPSPPGRGRICSSAGKDSTITEFSRLEPLNRPTCRFVRASNFSGCIFAANASRSEAGGTRCPTLMKLRFMVAMCVIRPKSSAPEIHRPRARLSR